MPAPQNAQQQPAAQPRQRESLTPEALKILADLTAECPLKFNATELELIWQSTPPITTWPDFQRFVYRSCQQQFNPLLNDIHIEYRNSQDGPKCSIVTHIEALRKVCHRSAKMDGFKQVDGMDERGFYVDTLLYVKGCAHPFEGRAYFHEFVVMKGDKPNYIWSKMERHMTAKTSEALTRRIAMPDEVGDLLIEEEMPLVSENLRQSAAEPKEEFEIGEVPESTPAPSPTAPPASQPPASPVAAPPAPAPPAPVANNSTPPANNSTDAKELYKAKVDMLMKANKGLTKGILDEFYMGYFGVETKSQMPRDPQQFMKAVSEADSFIFEAGLVKLIQNPKQAGATMRGKAAE